MSMLTISRRSEARGNIDRWYENRSPGADCGRLPHSIGGVRPQISRRHVLEWSVDEIRENRLDDRESAVGDTHKRRVHSGCRRKIVAVPTRGDP